jgi:hypothetical protein
MCVRQTDEIREEVRGQTSQLSDKSEYFGLGFGRDKIRGEIIAAPEKQKSII